MSQLLPVRLHGGFWEPEHFLVEVVSPSDGKGDIGRLQHSLETEWLPLAERGVFGVPQVTGLLAWDRMEHPHGVVRGAWVLDATGCRLSDLDVSLDVLIRLVASWAEFERVPTVSVDLARDGNIFPSPAEEALQLVADMNAISSKRHWLTEAIAARLRILTG
jgi:hypothetical protein